MSVPFLVMCACGHGQQEEFEDETNFAWKCEGCHRTNSFYEKKVHKGSSYPSWTGIKTHWHLGEEGRAWIDHDYQGDARDRMGWE